MSAARPPRWARAVAELLLPYPSSEFVVGDLEEMYHAECERAGPRRAALRYVGWVVRSAAGALAAGPLTDLVVDLRYALRGLRRNPTFAAVAVLTSAIGIGATTAMLSVASAVLLRPPAIHEPERMVSIWELRDGDHRESMEGRLLPHARYEAYRAATEDVFEGLAGHAYMSVSLLTDDGAVSVDGFHTSPNYFEVLGLVPARGRFYDSDDVPAIVISERLWRSRFGADPGVVGRTVSVSSRTFTVAAVAPPRFFGTMTGFSGDVWIPRGAYLAQTNLGEGAIYLVPLGRLRDGVDRTRAEQRVSELARVLPYETGNAATGARFDGLQWRTDLVGPLRLGVGILLGAAALLLLIAGVNIAGMLLARALDRRKEIAVRLAIGAGRGRLVRQAIVEGVLLGVLGGALGTVLAELVTLGLSRVDFPLDATVTIDATPDRTVLFITVVLSVATGLVFGLGPALRSTKTNVSEGLKDGIRGVAVGRRRNAMVVGQLALTTLLLVTAGVLTRSYQAVATVPLGFDPDGLAVATIGLGSHGYDAEARRVFFDQFLERLRGEPGVETAALARFVLLGGANASNTAVAVDGATDQEFSLPYNVVDPEYFAATGMELVEGRLIDDGDVEGSPRVAVVNERLATRLWPGESAVGRAFRIGRTEHEVVGVVADGVYVFTWEELRYFAFYPLAQRSWSTVTVHVRARPGAPPVGPEIRRVLRDLDPNVSASGLRTMHEIIATNGFAPRFMAQLTAAFATLGLLLAVIGVYGLIAVQVAQRGPEFSVRMALGATRPDVVLLVLRRAFVVTTVGCGAGVVAAAASGRWISAILYEVSAFDLVTFAGVPITLGLAATAAGLLPALRGTRVSAAASLRSDG